MPMFRAPLLKPIIRVVKRNILSEAYMCVDKWNSRFSSNSFGNVSAGDLGTEILYRLSNQAPVSPLDYDIFVNKVQQADNTFIDYLEKISLKFRETQNSLSMLNSTSHAILRAYIHHQMPHRLLDLLKKRSLTGVFLDEVSANILVTEFLRKNDFDAAGYVMWELCLQSHFYQFPLTSYISALWLHTILESVNSGKYFVRAEVAEEESEEETEDVDFRRIPYLRNPNYDGWFDVDRQRLQIGHCTIALADAIEKNSLDNSLIPHRVLSELKKLTPEMRVIGLALLEDTSGIVNVVENFIKSGVSIDKEIVAIVEKLIGSSDRRSDDSEVKRGQPKLRTESEVASALEKFKQLSPDLLKNPSSSSSPPPQSFLGRAASLISAITTDPEILSQEVSRVEALYTEFESHREAVYSSEVELLRRRTVLAEVRGSLRRLTDEEERLSYFGQPEVAGEVERLAWLAPRTRRERRWSRMKEWKRELKSHQQRLQGGREAFEGASS